MTIEEGCGYGAVYQCSICVGCGLEGYMGHSVKNAVVTVPAYFNDSQRQVSLLHLIVCGRGGRKEHALSLSLVWFCLPCRLPKMLVRLQA